MTTTYELYTNENGTPKAVEGKAPAIIERVEALETDVGNVETAIEVLEGGVVKTINGETPDQAGNIDIPVGHNVGEEWISYTGKIPNGGVPYCGQTVTRATYADLWAYAQAQGLVKTESEWQSWSSSHGGNVPFYSSGDGSSTFRMPSIKGYVKGASSQADAGAYIKQGLPNITGTVDSAWGFPVLSNNSQDGAVSFSEFNRQIWLNDSTNKAYSSRITFDASNSNSIYGNSNDVTPETSTVLFGVFAFGEVINAGELDATNLAADVAKLEANVSAHIRVVESWRSGNRENWYRKWSDGWIEQGGIWTGTGNLKTISFNTPFSNNKFTISLTMDNVSTNNASGDWYILLRERYSTYVVVQSAIDYVTWYACGY